MAGPIRIAILANASQANRELKGFAGTADRIGSKFAKFRAPATLALGAIGLGAKKAIQSATDLQQTISKTDAIFGKNAASVKAWSKNSAKSFGLSQQQALSSAAAFGDMFKQIGFTGSAATKSSKSVVQMAADLGAFNDLPTAEVLDMISGGLRGEYDSLQRVIPNINAARVQQEAMSRTGKKNAASLTAQEKAAATLAIIQKDGARATGAFAREASSASGQQKIAAARAEDLSAKLGKSLLPAYTAVLQIANRFLGLMAAHPGATKAVIAALAGLSAAVLIVSSATKVVTAATSTYKAVTAVAKGATIAYRNAQFALNLVMAANPIALVIGAIVALAAIFVVAYKKSETFRRIVNKAWGGIKKASQAVFGFLAKYIDKIWHAIEKAVTSAAKTVSKVVDKGWDAIKRITKTAWSIIKNTILVPLRVIIALIKGDTGKAKQIMRDAWGAIRSATRDIWNAIKGIVRDKIQDFLGFVRDIPGKVKAVFSGAAGWLLGAGRRIIQGLIDGINSMIGYVRDKLNFLTDLIPDWKGPASRDKRLLRKNGQLILQGLIDGWDDMLPAIRRKLTGITGEIQGFDATIGGGITARAALAGSPEATAGTPVTYRITVQAPVGSSSADIGRTIVKHIDAYERAGGRRRA